VIQLTFPIYLAVRDPQVALPDVLPVVIEISAEAAPPVRACVAAWPSRHALAAWCSHQAAPLRAFAVRSVAAFDRLAVTVIGRFERRWLAFEPAPRPPYAAKCLDLVAWLAKQRPWTPKLEEFCETHELGTLQSLSYAV
jgi:hypothetical protein